MKTKIVYVLACSDKDFYLERTLISAYSARMHNPNAVILVVTDSSSFQTLKGKRAEIKKYVTDFVVVNVPSEYGDMAKSRYLKTSLRQYVTGDFLYIDCDTVICEALDEIDAFEGELGGVLSCNRPLPLGNSTYTGDVHINYHAKKVGWDIPVGYPNYNGGVIFSRDTDISRRFFNCWFSLWKECAKHGVFVDMLSLYRANIEMDCCMKELPGIWNCIIQRQGLPFLSQAKIIHTLTGDNLTLYELCSDRILEKVKRQGTLDAEVVELIRHARTAFPHQTTLVKSQDAALLSLPVMQLYHRDLTFFRILNKIAELYLKVCK